MGITIDWEGTDNKIIRITYQKPWDWDDFDAVFYSMIIMLDSASQTVDLVFDIRNGGFPPPGAVTRFKRVGEINHPNGGMIIFIGGSSAVMNFVNLFIKVYGRAFRPPNFIFVASPEEAHRLIYEQRSS